MPNWGNTFGKDYFEKGGKQTTSLASINKSVLKSLLVPIMLIGEVEALFSQIEASLAELDATEAEIENGLGKLDALRQSILKKAFYVRLVPQDPSDEPASKLLARLQTKHPCNSRRRIAAE